MPEYRDSRESLKKYLKPEWSLRSCDKLASERSEESLDIIPSETEFRVLVNPDPPSSAVTPSSVSPKALASALL